MSPATPIPPPQATPAAPRKKRPLKFWLKLAAAVFFGVPLLAYILAWGYLNLGFLNSTIESKLSKKFGAPAHVGSVKGRVLHGLDIENISIDSADKGPPLTVGSTAVEWDASELLRSGQLRTVIVDRPEIDLRYDPQLGWNYKLKLAQEGEAEVRIARFEIRDGTFASDFGTAGKLRFAHIAGTFTDLEKRAPSPFALWGELVPGAPLALEGSAGPLPGEFDVRALGRLDLARNLPALAGNDSGSIGELRFAFSANNEFSVTAAGRVPSRSVLLTGSLDPQNIFCALPGLAGMKLVIPADHIGFEARAALPGEAAGVVQLNGLRLNSSRFGNFSANGAFEQGPSGSLRLFDAGGSLDLEALNAALQPPLLSAAVRIKGSAEISDMLLRAPLGAGGPPLTFEALLTSRRLLLDVPGLGALPPVDLEAAIAWPALQRFVLKMADVGSLEMSVADLNRRGDPLAALDLLKIQKLHLDLGQFFDGALGRRLLAGTISSAPPPLAADMPYSFSGALDGAPLKTEWSVPYAPNGSGTLRLGGLRAENLSLRKWPLVMRAPHCSFSGPLTPEIEFKAGLPVRATLDAELAGKLDEPFQPDPGVRQSTHDFFALKLKYALAALPGGKWVSQDFEATQVRSSIVALDKAFRFLDGTGIALSGELRSDRIRFNAAAGALDGNLRVEKAACVLPVSDSMRAGAGSILRALNQGTAAAVLQSLGLVDRITLSDIRADLEFHDEGGKFSVRGTTGSFYVSVKLPLFGDYRAAQIPGVKFQFESTQRADGSYYHTGNIDFPAGTLSSNVTQLASGKWTANGKFLERTRGIEILFDGAFDDPNHVAGPFRISSPRLEMAALQGWFAEPAEPDKKEHAPGTFGSWHGAVTQLQLDVAPLSFGGTVPLSGQARVTGKLDDAAFACEGQAFEHLRGPFTLLLNGSRDSTSVDAQMTLDSYEALLCSGTLLLPPPPPGRASALKLALKIPGSGAADSSVRLEKCEGDLAGMLSVSASGLLRRDARGGWSATELNDILVLAPDLAVLSAALGPPNFKLHDYWFGELKLAGKSIFKGAAHWDAADHFGVDGKLTLEHAGLSIGAALPFTAHELSGEIPVSLRRDAGPPRDGGPHGTLQVGGAAYGPFNAAPQALDIEARSDGFAVHSVLAFGSYAGSAAFGPVELSNLWPLSADPRIAFRLALNIDVGQIFRTNNIRVPGTEACILSGAPLECALVKSPGARGPWEVVSGTTRDYKGDSVLTAPFLDGKLVLMGLNARGLFGPAPVLGGSLLAVGKNWPERIQSGISVQDFLKNFPKYGQFNARVRAALRNIELTSLDLNGVQNFTLEVDTAPHHKNDFFFDGVFAMALNYQLTRASFPTMFSDEYIRSLTFGINEMAFQYQLENGILKGPRPKLSNGMILEGYGAESNPFASRYRKDVGGDLEKHIPWSEFLRLAREKLK